MVEKKTVETTKRYDTDGNLIEMVTKEETSEDDTKYYPYYPYYGTWNGNEYYAGDSLFKSCGADAYNARNI